MIELSEETLKLYQDGKKNFEAQLVSIRQECEFIKKDFLSKDFNIYNSKDEINSCYSFFLQFVPYLNYLIYFSKDEEVISKLKSCGFTYTTLKWMIDINEIESEIRRLEKIEGLLIFPDSYLYSCIFYVSSKFRLNALEYFIGNVSYNGLVTNKIHVDFTKRIRRRNYNHNNKSKLSKDDFENLMNEQIDLLEKKSIENGKDKSKSIKSLLKLLHGDCGSIYELFQFSTKGISKNSVYFELFPLLKMIVKDKKLKSETEFFDNTAEQVYNNDYRLYRISKVKDILNLK
ncbi:MAG: hypothetical protein EAZ85_13390 [Bacteroidetes bacterium]|nr:MAG: hypothetical protein EAZ85_13390 [Bacteroidota bacterium]